MSNAFGLSSHRLRLCRCPFAPRNDEARVKSTAATYCVVPRDNAHLTTSSRRKAESCTHSAARRKDADVQGTRQRRKLPGHPIGCPSRFVGARCHCLRVMISWFSAVG